MCFALDSHRRPPTPPNFNVALIRQWRARQKCNNIEIGGAGGRRRFWICHYVTTLIVVKISFCAISASWWFLRLFSEFGFWRKFDVLRNSSFFVTSVVMTFGLHWIFVFYAKSDFLPICNSRGIWILVARPSFRTSNDFHDIGNFQDFGNIQFLMIFLNMKFFKIDKFAKLAIFAKLWTFALFLKIVLRRIL